MCTSDLEAEPVTEVRLRSRAQLARCGITSEIAIHVDVDGGTDTEITSKQRRGTFDDPSGIGEVQPLQQTVVGNMTLEFRQRPLRRLRERPEPIGEGAPER